MSSASDEMMVMTVLVLSTVDTYSSLHSKVHDLTHKSLYACTLCTHIYVYTPFFISVTGIKDRNRLVRF
jgi:hypothetical protein